MPVKHFFLKTKDWMKGLLFAQMVFVALAFALMVIVSYFYVSNIERKNLREKVKDAIFSTEAAIKTDLLEPETVLGSVAEIIRGMIMRGNNAETVNGYIQDINIYVNNDEKHLVGVNKFYGYFEAYGGIFINGDMDWTPPPPDYYVPYNRPWYAAAVEADGDVGVTQPYLNILTGEVMSFARRIFGEDGEALGIICLDIKLDRIKQLAVNTQSAVNGYGFLLSDKMELIAHPDPSILGVRLRNVKSNIADYEDELMRDGHVYEITTTDYRNVKSIVFIEKLQNGWYMGIVTPRDKFYQSISNMARILITLGAALAAILIIILARINAEKTKAEIKNQQKSNFLARMSHEIRTPMNAILGIAEIQLQDESLPQHVSEAFTRINNSGDLLIGIINDILDLSKIEAGKLELASANYDVPSLINDTVQLNLLYFESKPIEFKLFVDEHVPVSLFGDELRIKQILNNLLSNAFKYTERGEISLTVTAEYTPRGGAKHVPLVFRVSDTGQGMTAEQIRHLGDEYSRYNMEANRTTEGTGLGMSITMKLIQMMNGNISVESKPGKGTTVTVRLPQRNVGLGVSGTIGKELAENLQKLRIHSVSRMNKVHITRTPMPYGKVLIVDDVESNLYVAKGLMAPYGLSIDTATSGFEAIDKIKGGAVYDIIFMDHMMPKMDGIEAAKNIRGLGYTQPIIALTANALSGQAEIFMENGFDGFISKPIDIRQLNYSLNKLIRDKQPPEVLEAARQQALKANMDKAAAMEAHPASDQELAAIFVRDAEKALERLDAIYSNAYRRTDDIRIFVINVHAMKSALANIGETELSAVAYKLEQAGRAEDAEALTAETPAFLEALREVIEKNKPKEGGGDTAEEDSDSDRAYLSEKLLAIRTACEEYDETAASTALAELEQKKWPRSVKELLDAIAVHLLHSDFEEAAKLAKDYSQKPL